jgi:predicted lysophospholipase L1 biosynthesis ABC-type transport system permease subunit
MGAGRIQLIRQFMVEAWVLALLSGALALGATYLSMPEINKMMDKQIAYDFLQNPILIKEKHGVSLRLKDTFILVLIKKWLGLMSC